MNLNQRTFATPIGHLRVIADDDAVVAVLWDVDHDETARNPVEARLGATPTDVSAGHSAVLDGAVTQLEEYFAGDRTEFDIALAPAGTEFQRSAWDALRAIPYGETATYGEQADRMGDRNKARAVGAANGQNPIPIIIPCHRVVGANGALTGFAGGLDVKRWLLEHEAPQTSLPTR